MNYKTGIYFPGSHELFLMLTIMMLWIHLNFKKVRKLRKYLYSLGRVDNIFRQPRITRIWMSNIWNFIAFISMQTHFFLYVIIK